MFVIFSVFYILIAAAMVVLILLQNGAGADAGSGFGGGASGTVFGARGSATFLTRATGVLAALFFLLSLGMGIYLHNNGEVHQSAADLGVMAGMAGKPAATGQPASPSAQPASEVPTSAPAATPSSGTNAAPAIKPPVAPAATDNSKKAAVEPSKKH